MFARSKWRDGVGAVSHVRPIILVEAEGALEQFLIESIHVSLRIAPMQAHFVNYVGGIGRNHRHEPRCCDLSWSECTALPIRH